MGKPQRDMWDKASSNGFAQNPQNINRKGRPRKLVSHVLKDMKEKGIKPVSHDEIKDIYLSLVNNTESEMDEILNDKDQPMLTKIVIKAIKKGKGIDVIEKMFDRAVGKAEQKTETRHSAGEWLESFTINIVNGDKPHNADD